MSISIRPAVLSDAPVLQALNRAFNGHEVALGWIERRLVAPLSTERILVADDNGSVVGFCCVSITESICYPAPRAEITELFVAQDYRQKGVGLSLLEEAIRIGKRASACEIMVAAHQENIPARKLYEHAGFDESREIRFFLKAPYPSSEATPL